MNNTKSDCNFADASILHHIHMKEAMCDTRVHDIFENFMDLKNDRFDLTTTLEEYKFDPVYIDKIKKSRQYGKKIDDFMDGLNKLFEDYYRD